MDSVGRGVAVLTAEDLGAVGNDARGDTLEVDVVLLVMASVGVAVMGKDLSAVGHGAPGGVVAVDLVLLVAAAVAAAGVLVLVLAVVRAPLCWWAWWSRCCRQGCCYCQEGKVGGGGGGGGAWCWRWS